MCTYIHMYSCIPIYMYILIYLYTHVPINFYKYKPLYENTYITTLLLCAARTQNLEMRSLNPHNMTLQTERRLALFVPSQLCTPAQISARRPKPPRPFKSSGNAVGDLRLATATCLPLGPSWRLPRRSWRSALRALIIWRSQNLGQSTASSFFQRSV